MKYTSFEIKKYRAIDSATIPVSNNLIPVIGVNESGKTTALQAILAFDKNKDRYQKGRHLEYKNKYVLNSTEEFRVVANMVVENEEDLNFISQKLNLVASGSIYQKLREFYASNKQIRLARVFSETEKTYEIENEDFVFETKKAKNDFANALYERLPFILYFDDFSDRVPEEISFTLDTTKNEVQQNKKYTEWHSIIEEIFKRAGSVQTLNDFLQLTSEDDRQGLLNDIQDTLNKEVMEDWKNLKKYGKGLADEVDDLELNLKHNLSEDKAKIVFKFKVQDRTNSKGRMFNITERSKGFQWFFNFIVKLKFNPKYQEDQNGAIYLLDEPGSYLHTSAQEELLNKLKDISETNSILYCTHSQYLLDPEKINISRIRIAKKENGIIEIVSFSSAGMTNNEGALTPLYQALHVKSGVFSTKRDFCIITEGITEYYLLNLLKKYKQNISENITIIPGGGAKHLKDLISQSIGFSKNYLVLLDSDQAGREAYEEYRKFFGDSEVENHFFKYQIQDKSENVVLEDHLSDEDKQKIMSLTSTKDVKMALSVLYYDSQEKQKEFVDGLETNSLNRLNIIVNKINKVESK